MRGRRSGFAVNVVAFRAGLDADVARRSRGCCRHRRDKDQGAQNTEQESHHFLFPGFEHEKLVGASHSRRPQQPQSTSTEMPVWAEAFSPFSSSARRMTTYRPWVKVCSASLVVADSPSPKFHVTDLILPLPPPPSFLATSFPPLAPTISSARRLPPRSLETFVSDCLIFSSMGFRSSVFGLVPAVIVPWRPS